MASEMCSDVGRSTPPDMWMRGASLWYEADCVLGFPSVNRTMRSTPGRPYAALSALSVSVGFVDAHRPASAHAVAVQKNHDLADDLLFRPRILDPLPALGANAVHILKAGRLRFDHVEDLL